MSNIQTYTNCQSVSVSAGRCVATWSNIRSVISCLITWPIQSRSPERVWRSLNQFDRSQKGKDALSPTPLLSIRERDGRCSHGFQSWSWLLWSWLVGTSATLRCGQFLGLCNSWANLYGGGWRCLGLFWWWTLLFDRDFDCLKTHRAFRGNYKWRAARTNARGVQNNRMVRSTDSIGLPLFIRSLSFQYWCIRWSWEYGPIAFDSDFCRLYHTEDQRGLHTSQKACNYPKNHSALGQSKEAIEGQVSNMCTEIIMEIMYIVGLCRYALFAFL